MRVLQNYQKNAYPEKNRDFQVAKNISHWSDTKVNTKKYYKKKILVVRSVQGARLTFEACVRFFAFFLASASSFIGVFGAMAEDSIWSYSSGWLINYELNLATWSVFCQSCHMDC